MLYSLHDTYTVTKGGTHNISKYMSIIAHGCRFQMCDDLDWLLNYNHRVRNLPHIRKCQDCYQSPQCPRRTQCRRQTDDNRSDILSGPDFERFKSERPFCSPIIGDFLLTLTDKIRRSENVYAV